MNILYYKRYSGEVQVTLARQAKCARRSSVVRATHAVRRAILIDGQSRRERWWPGILTLSALVTLCTLQSASVVFGEVSLGLPRQGGCELAWSDEFNGLDLNGEYWAHRALGPRKGAFVSEKQAFVDGVGYLVLKAERRSGQVHIGMVGTGEKFLTKYGYFETRVKLTSSPYVRSAFWLQTPTVGREIGNPVESGVEIDVFEFIARSNPILSDWTNHAIHWDGYGKHHKEIHKRVRPNLRPGTWHTFGMLWAPDGYIFYIDGRVTSEIYGPVSDVEQYLIFSVEYLPQKDIAKSLMSDEMLVDYVRVYHNSPNCPS
ncbi:glycoside hydrolase family 16 protein [Yangia mangrovi]|uniref:Glycoside hydrolase family 16 protein n=1 Tax=Alloyangia mangrovi TaxID=1779329 RepID=A0ABT2KS19_9RHOB|nr:glycoside hydrolase family 16 protein [Alloyangia mangrovi]MCT4372277.1 glycoside hydrolase family 16 protein [Alloyangia mangrovi]